MSCQADERTLDVPQNAAVGLVCFVVVCLCFYVCLFVVAVLVSIRKPMIPSPRVAPS